MLKKVQLTVNRTYSSNRMCRCTFNICVKRKKKIYSKSSIEFGVIVTSFN